MDYEFRFLMGGIVFTGSGVIGLIVGLATLQLAAVICGVGLIAAGVTAFVGRRETGLRGALFAGLVLAFIFGACGLVVLIN